MTVWTLLTCFHFALLFSPLADLADPQYVGKKNFSVHDNHRLLQVPVFQEVFSQHAQRSKVRGLRR